MSQDIAAADPGPRLRRRRLVLLTAIALVLIVAVALVAVSCTANRDSGPPSVRVDRGTVALAVSASGNIAPAGQQSLGFADGGTVSEVLVKVGDRVTAGQTLARIDDTVARQTLAQRRATLDQQLATLDKLQGGNSVEAAQATLDQARNAEQATREQVAATDSANRSATSRARTQLQFDQRAVNRAESQLSADRSSCSASPRGTNTQNAAGVGNGAGVATGVGTGVPTTTGAPGGGLGTATGLPTDTGLPTATGGVTTTVAPTTTTPTVAPPTTTSVRTVTTRVAPLAAVAPLDDLDDDLDDTDGRTGAACSRLLGDRQNVQQAQAAVVNSRSAVDAAQQREKTDAAAGQVSVTNARQNVVSAQNQLTSASNDRPDDISAQAAQVRDAQAGIAIAQQDVDETVITAPVDGTITAINGTAGEVVSAPSAVTPQSPGGSAPLPVADQSNSSTGTGAGSGGGTPGAGAFLVLDTADPFQLVVPFEEADAARVVPGQQVDVAVDALPDDPLTGRVTSVAPAGQNLSGIINYYATVVVQGGADRLRDGYTAEANVRVESVDNVLRVPAAAVRRNDGRPTVTVTGRDGKPVSMPFLAGLVGDDFVEVRSGLTDGDAVELPQATVTPAPDQGGPQGN